MTFGWLVPLLVTIAAFVRAVVNIRRMPAAGGFLDAAAVVSILVTLAMATIVSLAAWLIYLIWLVFG